MRVGSAGSGIVLHPTIGVDAQQGTMLGLVHAELLKRPGGQADHKKRSFVDKQSCRWLRGTVQAAELLGAGALSVTVIADREGDIYEAFALRPAGVDLVIRAGQDRRLDEGVRLFEKSGLVAQMGVFTVELPAAPGRAGRVAKLSLRWCPVDIARPDRRVTAAELAALPDRVGMMLVEAREIDPPAGVAAAHWRLLTTHAVANAEDAQRIVGFYRQRWTIEQVFRTLKSKGFDVEVLRTMEGPFEKLVAAALVAAITVFQLVRERDGIAGRPLDDVLETTDRPVLEAVNATLEGKTRRQKNPHPLGSLAYAAWVFARLGGWTGYYGKPGPIVMLKGFTTFQSIKRGSRLLNV